MIRRTVRSQLLLEHLCHTIYHTGHDVWLWMYKACLSSQELADFRAMR